MHGGVRKRALTLLPVEILNQSAESIELAGGRVPTNQNFFGGGFEMEFEHAFLVVHVYFDLFGGFGVGDCVAVADVNFGAIFGADAEEGADYTLLVGGTAGGVVEDREEGLGLDVDCYGGGGLLG